VFIHSGSNFGDTGVSISPGGSGYYSKTAGTGATSRLRFANANGQVGEISTSGSTTTYATSSDYRLKENVTLLTGATDRLKQIPVHRFNFIADPDKTVDGFIAHEVQDSRARVPSLARRMQSMMKAIPSTKASTNPSWCRC
jgi:hypothetical protein